MGLGWIALTGACSVILSNSVSLFGQKPLYPGDVVRPMYAVSFVAGQRCGIRLLSMAAGQPVATNLHPGLCAVTAVLWILIAAASRCSSQLQPDDPMQGAATGVVAVLAAGCACGYVSVWLLHACWWLVVCWFAGWLTCDFGCGALLQCIHLD